MTTKTDQPLSPSLLTKRFEEAREALFSWQQFDNGHEFYVKDLLMIDRRTDAGVACIIEYTGKDKPDGRVGFIVVSKRHASLFMGVHLIASKIPIDNNWSAHHEENIKDYESLFDFIYSNTGEVEERAQEMLAVRRQMLLYKLIFSDAKVSAEPSDAERLLIADAAMSGEGKQYCQALGEFVAKQMKA